MIIACPSCGARFNLDPAKLLPAGRNVRCAKCGHGWRQMPEGYTVSEQPPPAPPTPEPAPPEPPEAAPAEPAPAEAAALPEEAESPPPRPPETPAEMAQSLAAIAEQVSGAGRGSKDSEEGPNPIARLARRTAVPGMGPITVPPRMKPMRPAKRSSHLGLILGAGLIVGLLIAGYAFRDVIARTVPGAHALYALFGLATDDPAAELEISIDNARINTDAETGRKIFDLRATVFNLSSEPVTMPPLMVIPVDDAGSPLEPMAFRLEERVIAPGENIKFRKSFEDWPPTAPNFELRLAHAE